MTASRHQIAPPVDGHLIIDPTDYTPEQLHHLQQHIQTNNGWQHPDGIRWIIPVQAPTTTRSNLIRDGLPPNTITVAH